MFSCELTREMKLCRRCYSCSVPISLQGAASNRNVHFYRVTREEEESRRISGFMLTRPSSATTPTCQVFLPRELSSRQTGSPRRRHGSQRQQQAAVGGRPSPPGLQQKPLGQVHRAVLRKRAHRLCHPHLVKLHSFNKNDLLKSMREWMLRLFWRIWHMDLVQSAVLYGVMTLVSTYLVAFAYKNVKFVLKHKVAQKREDAVSKEVTRKLSEADNRKMSRKEKDERILWKKNEVADYEATTFSIFYNNTLFLVLVIVASFFLLKNFNPTVYPFSHKSLGPFPHARSHRTAVRCVDALNVIKSWKRR
uniref:Translocon-associated protein subunit gamma n=1 Tax=Scophthalmus maximus TaxID=52904 RepID=A0A8D3DWD8_SCOMX